MFKEFTPVIKEYLTSEYPQEGCGLIVKYAGFVPCENIADTPTKRFQISRKIKKEYEGRILAVIHSHPDGLQCPSASDMWGQMETQIPWGIARTMAQGCGDLFWYGDQVKKAPLVGRGFRHGVTDCYGLIRDWYAEAKNIKLKDFPRNWQWWQSESQNLYEDNLKKGGFRKLLSKEKPQIGDICYLKIRSKVVNHAAVLTEPGIILHHFGGVASEYEPTKLSVREPVGRWQKYIECWIRLHEAHKPEYIK